MRSKKTHAEPIQPVVDGDRHGFLYRWNTGEVQVMWLSDDDTDGPLLTKIRKRLQDSNKDAKI